tara:strand:+ start:455 stop:709 length:255 start_codon:yes stop_codon:yes gene_type:complete
MSCCEYGKCTQGFGCPVRSANWELFKSSKAIRRVRAGEVPPPEIETETYIEYDWDWDAIVYIYGITIAWVVLVSFVAGIFWQII